MQTVLQCDFVQTLDSTKPYKVLITMSKTGDL